MIELLTTTVEPDSWEDVGGPGSIMEMDNAKSLVISQTRDIHKKIAGVLASVRQVKIHQGIPSVTMPSMDIKRATSQRKLGPTKSYRQVPIQAWQLPHVHAE